MLEIFLILTFLFIVGSCSGWVLELLFRRFFSAKKWINPGFLTGPYLPLYGFGLVSLFAMSRIDFSFISNIYFQKVVVILVMTITVTFIEYLAGLIFIKGLKTKLWDYSDRKGNIQGIICPLFTFFWAIICAIYNLFIDPYVLNLANWFKDNIIYSFFVGIIFGIMIIDLAHSLHLATNIKRLAKQYNIVVLWEKFKATVAINNENSNEKRHFLFAFKSRQSLKEHFDYYRNVIKDKILGSKDKK